MARTMHISEAQAAQMGLLQGSAPAAVPKAKAKRGARRNAGQDAFAFQCRTHRLPSPRPQWELLKSEQEPRKDGKAIPRKWKFDFCWPEYNLIVEIDGGLWKKGGGAHSHPIDLERNMLKRNDAALAGFFVLSFAPEEFTGKRRTAIAFVIRTLASRGWQS